MNLFRDVIYPISGFCLIVAGVTMIYRPAGLIVGGLIFIVLSVLPRQ